MGTTGNGRGMTRAIAEGSQGIRLGSTWAERFRSVALILLPLAVGGLSGALSATAMGRFATMAKPPLSPPAWVFPIAWTVLYLAMGLSLQSVWSARPGDDAGHRTRRVFLALFATETALAFAWPIVFFSMSAYWAGFAMCLAMLGAAVAMVLAARDIRRQVAGALLIPLVAWLCFATYLSAGVAVLN